MTHKLTHSLDRGDSESRRTQVKLPMPEAITEYLTSHHVLFSIINMSGVIKRQGRFGGS